MVELISTTRYDPSLLNWQANTDANGGTPSPYLLLNYHVHRLRDAAQVHGWDELTLTLENVTTVCDDAMHHHLSVEASTDRKIGPFRIRIVLARTGILAATATPTSELYSDNPAEPAAHSPSIGLSITQANGPLLTVHLDTALTPSSVFTRTKTTHRQHYNDARERLQLPPLPSPSPTDVLLYNSSSQLTETSIRNVALYRNNRWVTPNVNTGCLPGVMRRWLLEHDLIIEARPEELTKGSVLDGEFILTFNGLEGCRMGRVTC